MGETRQGKQTDVSEQIPGLCHELDLLFSNQFAFLESRRAANAIGMRLRAAEIHNRGAGGPDWSSITVNSTT